jgi:hypothetical protein
MFPQISKFHTPPARLAGGSSPGAAGFRGLRPAQEALGNTLRV